MRPSAIRQFRDLALRVAERSTMRHRVGCIIVAHDNFGYASGFNRFLGDPDVNGWSLHAEAWAALRAEESRLQPKTAFIARHGTRLARPCPKCMEALRSAGVKSIHYTDSGNWSEEEIG